MYVDVEPTFQKAVGPNLTSDESSGHFALHYQACEINQVPEDFERKDSSLRGTEIAEKSIHTMTRRVVSELQPGDEFPGASRGIFRTGAGSEAFPGWSLGTRRNLVEAHQSKSQGCVMPALESCCANFTLNLFFRLLPPWWDLP
jgi:hypothetical protein